MECVALILKCCPGTVKSNICIIVDAKFVQDMRVEFPTFFCDPEVTPILCGLFIDAFSVTEGVQKSLMTVTLILFNLPPNIRAKKESLHLLMMIEDLDSGNMDGLLSGLLQELQSLWNDGIILYDASKGEKRKFKVALISLIMDGRSLLKVCKHSEAGSMFPCIKCHLKGQLWRGQYYYSNNQVPDAKDYALLYEIVEREIDKCGRDPEDEELKYLFQGVRGKCIFTSLPYWKQEKCVMICLMHTVYNIGTSIWYLDSKDL